MTKRVIFGLLALGLLLAGNVAWRIWSEWGLITVRAENVPVRDVIRSIERQSGARVTTNLPADRTVTMNVTKVTLPRAMQVLSNTANATWDVAHIVAPEDSSIEAALAAYESGQTAGWKVFSFADGPMRMMGGLVDPRAEKLETPQVQDGLLHSYLESASQIVDGQFWAPEDWNPVVTPPAEADRVARVVDALAGEAGGRSAEVLIVSGRSEIAEAGEAPGGPGRPAGGPGAGGMLVARGGPPPSMPDPGIMEKRMLARIEAMPEARREQARREFDERRKFFEEIASLPEDERAEKMRNHMEAQIRDNPGAMEARMTRMDASHTVEQRSEFFRRVIEHKQEAAR